MGQNTQFPNNILGGANSDFTAVRENTGWGVTINANVRRNLKQLLFNVRVEGEASASQAVTCSFVKNDFPELFIDEMQIYKTFGGVLIDNASTVQGVLYVTKPDANTLRVTAFVTNAKVYATEFNFIVENTGS